jgi:2-amino-4-hydroxy-6-hydroxymethyldihydropteridine diphosphokinase
MGNVVVTPRARGGGNEAAMIVIALGANLSSAVHGSPRATLEAALGRFGDLGLRVIRRSRWYETAPVPVSSQPWYVNAVVVVESALSPSAMLDRLQEMESGFGRVRAELNEPRILDLDIVDFDGRVEAGPPILPHPRLAQRAFVLMPLRDVAPGWTHPVTGQSVERLLADLPAGQQIRIQPD